MESENLSNPTLLATIYTIVRTAKLEVILTLLWLSLLQHESVDSVLLSSLLTYYIANRVWMVYRSHSFVRRVSYYENHILIEVQYYEYKLKMLWLSQQLNYDSVYFIRM